MHIYTITVAIATYNRMDYLRKLSKSLSECILIEKCHIRVYDDCSSELTQDDLKMLFPDAREIVVRKKNLGADGNMRQIYEDFLKTGDDLLVVMDSDLICNPFLIEFILANIDKTDGIMSLYNSLSHAAFYKYDDTFLIKEHIGSAGTVFKRNIIESIIGNEALNVLAGYDWEWSAYLNTIGIKLFAANESKVQHIGINGQNCRGAMTIQIGRNFKPVTKDNYDVLLDTYEKIIETARENLLTNYEILKETRDYRLGHVLLSPLRKIKKAFQAHR